MRADHEARIRADLAGKLREGHTRTRAPRLSRAVASGPSTPGCSSSLVSNLVAGLDVDGIEDGVDAVGGRAGDRHVGGRRAEQRRPRAAQLVDALDLVLEPRLAAATLLDLLAQRRLGRLEGGARHRPVRAGVQVGDPLEDRELGSELLHAGRILGCARP